MDRPPLEVADVFQEYGAGYRQKYSVSGEQARAMRAIELCRTAQLGGHVDSCDQCGHQTISYNSCRNRHCPKCQSLAREKWLQERQSELLPVDYFHVVFTVPEEIAALALQNRRCVYNILFRAVSQTLLTIAADEKHLGARIGFLAVLHTWGQNLLHHPHLHCVVPAGGLSSDGSRWIDCKHKSFFLSVAVLSKLFRGKFLAHLKQAFKQGRLKFHGKLEHLNDPTAFARYLKPCYQTNWVVYCKPPFGGPEHVLNYLGRYTHRIAISNRRLIALSDGKVSFSWKDYKHGNRHAVMTLDADEFIRRFLLHVLPNRFVRIRHYGLLANAKRSANLNLCRQLLSAKPSSSIQQDWKERYQTLTGKPVDLCPTCGKGRMILIEVISPIRAISSPAISRRAVTSHSIDSS